MNFEDIVLSEISQTQKNKYAWFHYMRYLKQANSWRHRVEWWLPETVGGRNGELVFNGPRVSVWGNAESSVDVWWWWLHSNVNVPNSAKTDTWKWLKWWIFCSVSFTFVFLWLHQEAGGILISHLRPEPVPPIMEVRSFNHWPDRECPDHNF